MKQLMTKVLELEAAYNAAEEVYKALETDFAIDQTDDKKKALERALAKSKDVEHEYKRDSIAENDKINECTITKTQAITDGKALLSLTLDSRHFQQVWDNLQYLDETNYTKEKATIKHHRAKVAEHQRKLDERNKLIAEAGPLTVNLNTITQKMMDCERKLVPCYETLVITKKLTINNTPAFTIERKKFDKLLQELRLGIDEYNQAANIWLSCANRIVRCMGIDNKDSVQKQWLDKIKSVQLKDFDQLLTARKIIVSSILDIPAEPQIAEPDNRLLPLPQLSPQAPPSPQPMPQPQILQPPPQPASLDKVVVRPADVTHNSHEPQKDQDKFWDEIDDFRPRYTYVGPAHSTASSPPPCSFKLSMLAFAARLLPLVYPHTPAKSWLARPAVARYAHADRARTAGGSLELHALCARIAHIAWLVHESDNLEPFAAHRFLIEVPENSRLLLRALSPLPHNSLYAARAAPSREHKNSAAIRECLSRSSLAPLRACAAAAVAAARPKDEGAYGTLINQSSQQYV